MVRFPIDHYQHYARQAAELGVPLSDWVLYRMAVIEGLPIPAPVLLDNPTLLALLPADQRAKALGETPGLGARYQAVVGADPLPGLPGAAASTRATGRSANRAA
jgi:hypothetical protein